MAMYQVASIALQCIAGNLHPTPPTFFEWRQRAPQWHTCNSGGLQTAITAMTSDQGCTKNDTST